MTRKLKEHYIERFKGLVLEKEIRFTNFTPCQRSLNRKREIQIIKTRKKVTRHLCKVQRIILEVTLKTD